MIVSVRNVALTYLMLGMLYQHVQCQRRGCETCYICDEAESRNAIASEQSWFINEMFCDDACLSYKIQSKSDGTTSDTHCGQFRDFKSCRGKRGADKCNCIRHVCNRTASFNERTLAVVVGLLFLIYQIGVRT